MTQKQGMVRKQIGSIKWYVLKMRMGLLKMWILGGHQSSRKNVRSIKISENQQKLDWMRKTVRIRLHIRKFSRLLWNNQRSFHHTCNGTIRTFHMHIICFLFTTETGREKHLQPPLLLFLHPQTALWITDSIIKIVLFMWRHISFTDTSWGRNGERLQPLLHVYCGHKQKKTPN